MRVLNEKIRKLNGKKMRNVQWGSFFSKGQTRFGRCDGRVRVWWVSAEYCITLGKMRPWKYWVTDAAIEFKLTCFCELGQSCENSRSFIQKKRKRNERVSCRGGNKERRVHNVTDDRQ